MKQSLMVMNTDSINCYGDRFSVGALVLSLQDECMTGVPMLVSHDASRIIGWTYPIAVHLEPGLTRLVGIVEMAENDEEYQKLIGYYNCHFYQTCIMRNQTEFEHLKAILANYLHGEEKNILTECVAVVEPGLAKRVCTKLFSQQDRDGLIPINSLQPIGPGVFKVGELAVFAHQFFRRNLFRLNTLNYPFLGGIQEILNKNLSVKIALDPDMVGLASTYNGGRVELAYWWRGPEFNDNLVSIPTGVSHYEADKLTRYYFGISGTQFRWGSRSGQHIFELEELRNIPTASEHSAKYGCRYVHSIVKEKTGEINHFDGSIRMYSEEEMLQRLAVDLAHAGRNTEYIKLWRIDGLIEVSTWKRLLAHYFRDNYLIGEYLGAKKRESYEIIEDRGAAQKNLIEEYVPHSMSEGMGIRVALSYKPRNFSNEFVDRRVISLDRISDGTAVYSYVESAGLELKKVLNRVGASLYIPAEVKFISFKDFYINFPFIFHGAPILPEGLSQTIDAIKILVDVWKNIGQETVISYKIGFPVDDEKEAWISVLGHVTDISKWLSNPLAYPSLTTEGLHAWSEKVAKYLTENYPSTIDTPPLFETLMTTGILLINRKPVVDGDFRVRYSEKFNAYLYEVSIPKGEEALASTLQAEGICPGIGILIIESRCTHCDQPYSECNCSKLLDKGVAQEITNAIPFPFWTDRPL